MIAGIRELVAHRALVRDFAWRDLRARTKGSVLGFAWNFLNPLLQLAVYWLLFGVLLGIRVVDALGREPAYGYAIFLFVGLLPWTYFAGALQSGANSVLANGSLVKKVRLPLEVLPASAVLSSLVAFAFGLVVLGVALVVAGVPPRATLVFVPLLIAIQTVLALGLAYLLAAAAVFLRDVLHILGVLLTLWYFLTPIIFPAALLADRPLERTLLYLNPMTPLVTGYQRAILDGLAPEWEWLAYTTLAAAALFWIGAAVYRRTSGAFEEEL